MSVQISIDQASLTRLERQLSYLRENTGKSALQALVKAAMAIKTEAQLRLLGRGHIVTSRLRNSIFIKAGNNAKIPNNDSTYSDNLGKSFNADLPTVSLSQYELAIGTNVEYATKIEVKDSYLYWAFQNVNVEQALKEKMTEDFERFKV